MTHRISIITLAIIVIILSSCSQEETPTDFVSYVNPIIGTAPATTISALKHGEGTENNAQVVPYVTTPFGMTNWTPQTRDTETKCVAPYYYRDSIIQGFRGSHWLSGSCVQDYGSMTLMPISGKLKCRPAERGSGFSHDSEVSTPFYYSVYLDDYRIETEITATKRTGIFRFTFQDEGEAHVVFNPNSDEGQGYISILPARNEIEGYNPVHRIYQGGGEEAGFSGYFVARFDRVFQHSGVFAGDTIFPGKSNLANEQDLGGYVSFTVKGGDQIHVKVGTSFTSIEQARKNLEFESGSLGFEDARLKLRDTWEELLSRVRVEGDDDEEKIKFYTALYHAFLHPRTFNDCDGSYVSFAGGTRVMNSGEDTYFVDFSMWDAYRASHPLFTLLVPEASSDMVKSLFLKAEQGGWLPIFPCWNSYTSAMIGDHVIATVADAYVKGVIDLTEKQYGYLLKNAFQSPGSFETYVDGKGRRALKSYLEFGYIPLEDEVNESFHTNEQVSRTLEYAFDDFALSQVAMKSGDSATAEALSERALNYRNVYSRTDTSVRGRYADGRFVPGFNKYVRQPYITEGTPFQYTWYVPHDLAGLMDLMGGKEGFVSNLDHFHHSGQYWHGNEPGHQIPFLYNYAGQPWKTREVVADIMEQEYGTGPGGLSGNDDAGQMSAWYVFAALGFYPVCPSLPEYVISGPHFDRITLRMENGDEIEIHAPGASGENSYVRGLIINGKETDRNFLQHSDLTIGGKIEFIMNNKPGNEWGTTRNDLPYSLTR